MDISGITPLENQNQAQKPSTWAKASQEPEYPSPIPGSGTECVWKGAEH